MAGTHQCIHHGNTDAGFAGSCGHDQQKITFFLFDTFEDSPNGPNLIVTSSDGGVYQFPGQRFAIAANVLESFKVITGGKSNHLARRIIPDIPEVNFMAVGVKTERQFSTELILNILAVLFGLFPANFSIFCCFFGFDNGKGLSIFAQQYVIAEL